jgi:predicted O-methyltransferase YrrM
LQLLPKLLHEGVHPFDFIFIDADKENYAGYLEWALKLSRHGTLIIADNVVRKGAIIDSFGHDSTVLGVRRFYEVLAKQQQAVSAAIQTVGSKGHDGFALILVNQPRDEPVASTPDARKLRVPCSAFLAATL